MATFFAMLAVLCLLLLDVALGADHWDFSPDRLDSYKNPFLPSRFSWTESQFVAGEDFDSHWTASFVTTKCNSTFVIHSNIASLGSTPVHRSSILNIGEKAYSGHIKPATPADNLTKSVDGRMFYELEAGGFEGLSEDSVANMSTWGKSDDYEYSINYNATTRVIQNAGAGQFDWGSGNTSQWSLPSCETSGNFQVNGTQYEILPEKSTTWYDRQWGIGGITNGNFTWFGIQFPGSQVKASVWASDSSEPSPQILRFATVNVNETSEILGLRFAADWSNAWTSPTTNNTYAQRWTLDFDNGDYLDIESVYDGQEIASSSFGAWSGFAKVNGRFKGLTSGFAFIDNVV